MDESPQRMSVIVAIRTLLVHPIYPAGEGVFSGATVPFLR
jgi:hypothetical protein